MIRPLLAALFLVSCAGLSGCSDDRDPSGSPETPTSTPAAPSSSATEPPATPARDACKVLKADEVGQVLGAEVEATVGEGGCRFASPEDPDATSLGVVQGELKALGGLDGAESGITTVVDGEVEDLSGVGDGAFVVVGPAMNATLTGAGAVAVGSSLLQITVIPGPDATEDDVRRTTVEALTLIAERTGS